MGRRLWGVLIAGLVLVAAEAALASSQPTTGDETPMPDMKATPLTPEETLQAPRRQSTAQPLPTNRVQRRVTQQAMEDLAQRLALPVERIEFLEFRSMLWPDAGLGCPRYGMNYLQVQQEGYLIRLRAGKREFDYHGGGLIEPYLCEKSG